MNRLIFIPLFILFLIKTSFEQEQMGLHSDNFAGINSISLNPANSLLTPYNWDLNIVNSGMFYKNNYVYAKNINTFKIIKNIKNITFQYDTSSNINDFNLNKILPVDFNDKNEETYLALSGNLTGPSISVKLGNNNMIGFFSGFRFLGGIPKIPTELNYYTFYNRPFSQVFQLSAINAGFISWEEYGIHYTKKVQSYPFIALAGGTLKYLIGNEAMYFKLKNGAQFKQLHYDSLAISEKFNLEYGYTNTSLSNNKLQIKNNGNGFSIDLGSTFIFGEKLHEYKFRLGISILDLGFINFNSNAFNYKINIDSITIIDLNEFKNITQLSDLDSLNKKLSQVLLNDSGKSLKTNSFRVMTPTALSIQFDYSFSKLFYLQTILVQRLKFKNQKITRPSVLSVLPRIEHKWFSFSPSIMIYDWKTFHLGASLRIAYLTIGSDYISGLFKDKSKYTGSDIYLGLKFNPLVLGKRNKHNRNLNKHIKCYYFD